MKILFSNPGKLDIEFIRMMGVSVKSDTAIGFFGTGLKYAIATILRLGGEIKIYIGKEEYNFTVETKNIRGKDFERVLLNGEPLAFTTELGRHWEAWMAVRELYSNALDEGGEMSQIDEYLPADGDFTEIIVSGAPFWKVYAERENYFIDKSLKPLYTTPYADVYHQVPGAEQNVIFYKGIRVGELGSDTKYRYNITSRIELTEDRNYRYNFEVREALEKTIITANDEHFLREVLVSEEGAESCLAFHCGQVISPSEEFVKVCDILAVQSPKGFNRNALRWLDRKLSRNTLYQTVEPTKMQAKQIERSLNCLRKMGYEYEVDTYPLKVCNSLGEGVMGKAHKGVMYLSRECFEQGTKYVCSTILEEFVHLKLGFADYTRELQTWLFDKVISMAEEFILEEPL